MKLIFPYCILLLLMACGPNAKQQTDTALQQSAVKPAIKLNYDSCKKQISIIKQQQKSGWNKLSATEKEKVFTKTITETIVPGWIGTKWDFNGTTEIPQQGSIACGYFVTTVLRDAGLQVARVKLAQMASEQMIRSLVQSKFVHQYSNFSITDFTNAIAKQGFGLYIIGLDNHTGFIYNDGNAIYFIHSTIVGTRDVQKEIAADSWVLKQSKYKVLGKISADEKVLQRWMN